MLRPPVLSRMLATLMGSAAASPTLLSKAAALLKASAPEAVRKNWRRLSFMMTSSHIRLCRADHSARFLLRGGPATISDTDPRLETYPKMLRHTHLIENYPLSTSVLIWRRFLRIYGRPRRHRDMNRYRVRSEQRRRKRYVFPSPQHRRNAQRS